MLINVILHLGKELNHLVNERFKFLLANSQLVFNFRHVGSDGFRLILNRSLQQDDTLSARKLVIKLLRNSANLLDRT